MNRLVFLALALLTTAHFGCASNPADPADTGRRDTGRRDTNMTGVDTGGGMCGELGGACCSSATRCVSGAVCGPGRLCCGVPQGAACTTMSDCCGTLDCVASKCCAVDGSPCRTPSECCGGLLCESGVCRTPMGGCGGAGQACCAGSCTGGLACISDMCQACGADGQMCCRPPAECGMGLLCTSDVCSASTGCGNDGEMCCAGDTCTGTLTCTAGTCSAPASACDQSTCGDCVAAAGGSCGWCDGGSTCMEGDATGPSTGMCSSGWSFGGGSCPAAPDTCPTNTDCRSCALDTSYVCGWCTDTNSCKRGTGSGADDGSCMDPNWAWLTSECPAGPDTCPSNMDCGSCIGDAGGNCGWCANWGTCRVGTFAGPDDSSCSGTDWKLFSSECSASMCSDVRGMCTIGTDCCGTLACRQGVTFPTRCCGEVGESCVAGADCCGYLSCTSGSCGPCRAAGRACLEGADCCSTTCTGGFCG